MVAGTVTLILGCERSAKRASSKLAPTPETDPLAQPKSLQQVGAPVEMTREKIPADNPQNPEKISLGQKLFFDRRLSADGMVSCSTCHDPAFAFTDRKPTSIGIKGRVGQRNAPTVLTPSIIRRSSASLRVQRLGKAKKFLAPVETWGLGGMVHMQSLYPCRSRPWLRNPSSSVSNMQLL